MFERFILKTYIKKQGAVPCFLYKTTDSTNLRAKQMVAQDKLDGNSVAVVALKQTKGRGRYARTFISDYKRGVYMSFVCSAQPNFNAGALAGFCALAVVQMLQDLYKIESVVKWPNDVYVDGKKICGILPESTVDSQGKRYFILGVGVNINFTRKELKSLPNATSARIVTGKKQNLLLAIAKLDECLNDIVNACSTDYQGLISLYKEKCSWLFGREVNFDYCNKRQSGQVVGLGEDCSLIVNVDGKELKFNWGEISIKYD